MKAQELRAMTPDELDAKLKELKSELFNLRFQHAINQLENPHKIADVKKDLFMLRMQHATNHLDNPTKISATRRDIARVKTVLREKQN